MAFGAHIRKLSLTAMSVATFVVVSHLFFFAVFPMTSADAEVHHNVATHDHKDAHVVCPSDIHQFIQQGPTQSIDVPCAIIPITELRVARLEILYQLRDFSWPYLHPPQENTTVLLI